MKSISGEAAKSLINTQIELFERDLATKLAVFEPTASVKIWLNTLRSIEELINLPFSIDSDFLRSSPIFSVELQRFLVDPELIKTFEKAISQYIYLASVKRIVNLIVQTIAIGISFKTHGFKNAIKMESNLFGLISYYQSRRKHIVSLLYCMPHYCNGEKVISDIDSLNHFLPFVEYNCNEIYSYQVKLVLADVYSDFEMKFDDVGGMANYDYKSLDEFFLEPERISLLEFDLNDSDIAGLETFDRKSIFSSEELRNSVLIIKHAYKEFLSEGDEFSKYGELVIQITRWCDDGFNISLDDFVFRKIMANFSFSERTIDQLIIAHENYSKNSNSVAPFIKSGGKYLTTTMLLHRFLYSQKNRILGESKRYKIRSGFIFEDNVKAILKENGFNVSDVKRINRREFDVIIIIGNGVLNIQCKNNSIELSDVSLNPKLFVKYNRFLDRYYERSLKKELSREYLLIDKFSCNKVEHIVLSKFPVLSRNSSIVNFRDFGKFVSKIKLI